MSTTLFIVTPTIIGGFFSNIIDNKFALNLIEGITRLCILFIYIVTISKNKDIQRVFQYHGAEHKAIYCYENNLELKNSIIVISNPLHIFLTVETVVLLFLPLTILLIVD